VRLADQVADWLDAAAAWWVHEQMQGPRRRIVEELRAIVPVTERGGPYR
jgi:hypothetical protein